MRPIGLALTIALAAGAAAAQSLDRNVVERNNDPWLVESAAKHTNGQNYLWPPNNPTAFSNLAVTTGVAANTLTYRWIPGNLNNRAEARAVSGIELGISPSAATTSYPLTGYFPEFKIHVPKAQAGGFVPDTTATPLLVVAQASLNFQTFGRFVVSSTLATPIPVTVREVVMSWKWQGGENDNVSGKQGLFGSYSDGEYAPLTFGFVDPLTSAVTLTSSNFSVLWGTYMEEQASIAAQSDYGYRRDAQLLPQVSGYSIGTGQADLATKPCKIGWDVFAGPSLGGGAALPLCNFGPVFPTSFQLLGQTLELNIADPALGLLASAGYVLTLDPKGFGDGALVTLPPVGAAAIGLYLGVEFAVIDASLTSVKETTQSYWIQIAR